MSGKHLIYADNAASTKPDPQVVKEMVNALETYGNPSSLHDKGQKANALIEKSRETIAKTINADSAEIIFTSGGTMADNLALQGIADAMKEKGNHLITTKFEHPAVLHTAKALKKKGFDITIVEVDSTGHVDPKKIKEAMREDTILVSVMHANNELGTIQPIEEIAKICRQKNIYFHTDAVQTYGKIKIDVKEIGIDIMSLSSHKIYGPKGMGALYIKKGTKINPITFGGIQERKIFPGTENVPGIAGFAKAAELMHRNMEKEAKRIEKIKKALEKQVLQIPNSWINGAGKKLPTHINFGFDYIEGEALLLMLNDKGICGSTGSACSSHSLRPSHVLLSIGLSHVQAHGSLRLSLGKNNSIKDVSYIYESIKESVKTLRSYSPLNRMRQ